MIYNCIRCYKFLLKIASSIVVLSLCEYIAILRKLPLYSVIMFIKLNAIVFLAAMTNYRFNYKFVADCDVVF